MAYTIAPVTNTNTFAFLVTTVNQLGTMANVALTTNSNTAVGNASITGTMWSNTISIGTSSSNTTMITVSQNTTGLSAQLIDTYTLATSFAASYVFSVLDNNAVNYYASHILTTHDNATAYITEYSTISTNGTPLGVFSANVGSGNIQLYFTPISTNTTVKFVRTLI